MPAPKPYYEWSAEDHVLKSELGHGYAATQEDAMRQAEQAAATTDKADLEVTEWLPSADYPGQHYEGRL